MKLVVPELVKQNIGILGMKAWQTGFLRSNTVTPIECLHYALNLPTSVVVTGIDSMEILISVCSGADIPMNDEQVRSLLAKQQKRHHAASLSHSKPHQF